MVAKYQLLCISKTLGGKIHIFCSQLRRVAAIQAYACVM
jgi:hypothetical protein